MRICICQRKVSGLLFLFLSSFNFLTFFFSFKFEHKFSPLLLSIFVALNTVFQRGKKDYCLLFGHSI